MNSTRRYRSPAAASNRQTLISLLILTLLCVICISVWQSQSRYNPAVRALTEDVQQANFSADTRSQPAVTGYLQVVPQSLMPLTAMEKFGPQNLSDKINGKAELYLSAGFKSLESQRFATVTNLDDWLEIFVYRMASQENAFGVYSAQQRDDAVSLDICRFGYLTANAVYCVHGPFYLEVIGATAEPATIESARSLVAAFVRDNPVQTQALNTANIFPKADLIGDSMVMIAADAFGFEKLDHVYVAEYSINGKRISAYLSERKSSAAAADLAAEYQKFLLNFGGKLLDSAGQAPPVRMIEIFETYETIFTRGPYLAGVHEAPDREMALLMTDRLNQQLQQAGNEP